MVFYIYIFLKKKWIINYFVLELFYAQQNAKLVADAEEYYRKMYHADEITWNIRDKHMAECVLSLIEFHKKKHPNTKPKVILWVIFYYNWKNNL